MAGQKGGLPINIIAVIPARGGSKGIPNKNITALAGYPLIAYSIAVAKLADKIDRVIVSTDSTIIADIAKKYGAEVPFLRPAQFASDKSTDLEYIQHMLIWMENNEACLPNLIVLLRPTTPLRDSDIIDQAIEAIQNDQAATSLRSGHLASESPFKWFLRDDIGYFKSIVPNLSNEDANGPRQEFPEVYIPDGYVDVLKPDYIKKTGKLFGNAMIGFISPMCVEIDTFDDLEQVQYIITCKKNTCYDYLKSFDKQGES